MNARKAFDVVNIMQRLYRYSCILCAEKDQIFQLPVIYGQKVHRLRSSSSSIFKQDLDHILQQYPNETLVYLPVSEKPTRRLLQYLEDKKPDNLHYLLPTGATFHMTSNKGAFQEYCEQNGFPVPNSLAIDNIRELKQHFRPLILKPTSGQGSVGIKHIDRVEDLYLLEKVDWDHYILQEKVLSSDKVSGAFFLCRGGQVISSYSHQRLRTFPEEGGVTVYSRSTENESIRTVGERLLKQLNWDGVAMIEFMYDEPSSKWKIIELNPRLWGSILLSAFNQSGMLDDYVKASIGQPLQKRLLKEPAFIRWIFPFDLMNWFRGKIPFSELVYMNLKNTCYINFTYSSWYRSTVYLMYFTINFSSIKRFIKKFL